jgi:hypothetical protein
MAGRMTPCVLPDLLRLTQDKCAFGNQYMLTILAIDRIRHHHLDWTGKLTIETVHKSRIDGRSLKEHKWLAMRGVDVYLRCAFAAGGYGWCAGCQL